MENNKLIIDIEQFKGKKILELRTVIHAQLSRIKVNCPNPTPDKPNRSFDYYPYSNFGFEERDHNYEIIKEITIE